MKLTIEELRKVYSVAYNNERQTAALLAVYRLGFKEGAERQRAVEPTEEMLMSGTYTGTHYLPQTVVEGIYRAMQSVAPLVVPE